MSAYTVFAVVWCKHYLYAETFERDYKIDERYFSTEGKSDDYTACQLDYIYRKV